MKSLYNIMLLDDDLQFQKQCTQLLGQKEDYKLLAVCKNIREAMLVEDMYHIDLVIAETFISNQSGLRYINGMLNRNPKTKVLILSKESDFDLIKQAFKIGVHGYLTKPVLPGRIVAAIKTVFEDGTALSQDVSSKIVAIFREKSYPMLTKRENQIMGYLGEGATYKDVARKLFVTPSTVNFHLQNIYLKLNVNSKSEALKHLKTIGGLTHYS